MFFRKHKRVSPSTGEHSMTKQAHKRECDINTILAQYQRTGIINHINQARPTWEDLPDSYDFQSSLNTINQAESAFAALPAKVREKFDHSPLRFLEAFTDPDQADELRALGLVKPKIATIETNPAPTPPG